MLPLKIEDFSTIGSKSFSVTIESGKSSVVKTSRANINGLICVIAGITGDSDYHGNMFLNGINIRNDRYARDYLKKHTLSITGRSLMIGSLTVKENIQTISRLWSGHDLSDATISAFDLSEIKNKFIHELSDEDKIMMTLTPMIACPSHFWIINASDTFQNPKYQLSDKKLEIVNNVMQIRLKQFGSALIMQEK